MAMAGDASGLADRLEWQTKLDTRLRQVGYEEG